MAYVLFLLYAGLLGWMMTRLRFVRAAGFSSAQIISLFAIKITAGVAIGFITHRLYPDANDYWNMNREGWIEYQLLLTNPTEFCSNLFTSVYHHYHGFFDSMGSYWNDLKNNLIIKGVAICNIFSQGNYYINSLFFNSFSFLGLIALYRMYLRYFSGLRWAMVTAVFLLPSTLYFCSGIYKDLIVFSLLGFYLLDADRLIRDRVSWKTGLRCFVSLLGILLIRNYLVVLLVPLTLAYAISYRYRINEWKCYAATIGTGLLLSWLLPLIRPGWNPLAILLQKKNDFAALPSANSQLPMPDWQPNLWSMFQQVPSALEHACLRPFLWEGQGITLLALSIELSVYIIIISISIFCNPTLKSQEKPSIARMALVFACLMLLITGLIIPSVGAISRYRSLFLPLILAPVLARLAMANGRK
ncbi:MAG TPA: hypothetical protein PKK69_07980, partial [Ferruginibacter sp.]|nr:hypothetical protein [Ferruginibacter sp.]